MSVSIQSGLKTNQPDFSRNVSRGFFFTRRFPRSPYATFPAPLLNATVSELNLSTRVVFRDFPALCMTIPTLSTSCKFLAWDMIGISTISSDVIGCLYLRCWWLLFWRRYPGCRTRFLYLVLCRRSVVSLHTRTCPSQFGSQRCCWRVQRTEPKEMQPRRL